MLPEEPSGWTIPTVEYEMLTLTLLRAEWVAQSGDIADGYMLLLEGEERVCLAATDDCPWSADLRECWAYVIDDFRRRYGLENRWNFLLDSHWRV